MKCTCCGEDKPDTDFQVRSGTAKGRQSHCKPCMSATNRAWYERNKARKRAAVVAWREINTAAYAEKCKEYKERTYDQQRAAGRAWDAAHPERKNHHAAMRRARKRSAMPPWADASAISVIYHECRRVSDETGVLHNVDHIIPLRGKTVSGLHVPWNLRIITEFENKSKSTKFNEAEAIAFGVP